MAKRATSARHGFILVDKPRGPTSHDMVLMVRRVLAGGSVGHAGTLDPMATGLLVLAVGQATKLLQFVTLEDKEYQATITLGSETDTLDAEGKVIKLAQPPEDLSRERVEERARRFIGTIRQRPPTISAIKRNGIPLYRRALRGERVEAPLREVVVHDLRILDVRGSEIDLHVRCGKGFYLRAFARDLALALGTVGHLSALRRTRIGPFTVDQARVIGEFRAAETDGALRAALREKLIPLVDACRGMKLLVLSEEACQHAFHGRPVQISQICDGSLSESDRGLAALLNQQQQLVAVARIFETELRVIRGFRY
ncbi:MAG: tRNA pseudouridine(55) synthase TruB [Deltaproteobacteria bacterium]|nr:tRNA pseudouridine(55) synthase TruB [Deltaproteobacteria bacterium]